MLANHNGVLMIGMFYMPISSNTCDFTNNEELKEYRLQIFTLSLMPNMSMQPTTKALQGLPRLAPGAPGDIIFPAVSYCFDASIGGWGGGTAVYGYYSERID